MDRASREGMSQPALADSGAACPALRGDRRGCPATASLLDAGCGDGGFLTTSDRSKRVVGVDSRSRRSGNPRLVARAARRAQAFRPRFHVSSPARSWSTSPTTCSRAPRPSSRGWRGAPAS
jgi:hypothetical protein